MSSQRYERVSLLRHQASKASSLRFGLAKADDACIQVSANDADDHIENVSEPANPQSTPSSPPPSFRSRTSSPSSRHLLSSDPITTEAERTLADTFDDGSDSDDDGNNEGDDRQRLMRVSTVQSESEQRIVHDRNKPYTPRTATQFPDTTPPVTSTVPVGPLPRGALLNSRQNDGVFANLNAKPERGEDKEELPPVRHSI